MNKNHRTVSVSGALLAIAFVLLLAGRLSAGDDDTKAEESIKAIGGKVVRDDKATGKPVIVVDLTNTKVTDAGLKELELAELTTLQTLSLSGPKVTDAGLKELAGLKTLQSLGLVQTKVTDAGLKELAGLKSLQTLRLIATARVTDAGVAELQKALPKCKVLR